MITLSPGCHCAGLGFDAAGCIPTRDPADRRRGADVEHKRRRPRTLT